MKTSPEATRTEFAGALAPGNRGGHEFAAPHLSKTAGALDAGLAGGEGLMPCNRREQEQVSA